ncbi:MAG: hypothetical protein J0M17_08910 [Planctomycetes bacterium]|nr:hypothetical protein [Planctomycetota bacterium]
MRNSGGLLALLWNILTAPLRALVWLWETLIVAPYYDVAGSLGAFFGRFFKSGRGPVGFLIDLVLYVPRLLLLLLTSLFQWIWWAITAWPRLMQWQDLVWGLPSVVIAGAAVWYFLAIETDNNTLLASYQDEMREAFEKSGQTKDDEVKQQMTKRALFFARSLTQLQPLNQAFRYNLAMLYNGLGEEERGMAIVADLAPRDSIGFGPAHVTRAHQIFMKPMGPDEFNVAVAHMESALKSTGPELNRNDVHRELGELYFQAYVAQESGGGISRGLSKDALLENAKKNYLSYQGEEVQPILRLSTILALQGNYEQARRSVQRIVDTLRNKLEINPTDVQSRVELARVLASAMELREASDVLEMGRIRKPDPRLDQELSNVHFARALEFQRRMPAAAELPFQALRSAFEANPGNGLVVARILQSLLGAEKEAALARAMLAELPQQYQSSGVAQFLLGYDADRRQLPQVAAEHYGRVRQSRDSLAPAVIAAFAAALIARKYSALPPSAGLQLTEAAMRIWPDHPDLLFIRGQTSFNARRYAEAIALLNKAVGEKKNDVTLTIRLADDVRLHQTLGSAYAKLGQRENAEDHMARARAAHARRESLQ